MNLGYELDSKWEQKSYISDSLKIRYALHKKNKSQQSENYLQAYHSTKKGGHGLGMMIVQRIMRDHGGQIGIESSQGTGTVITLQFPQKHRRTRLLEGQ